MENELRESEGAILAFWREEVDHLAARLDVKAAKAWGTIVLAPICRVKV